MSRAHLWSLFSRTLLGVSLFAGTALAADLPVNAAKSCSVYDFIEITAHPPSPLPANPFTDASLRAEIKSPSGQVSQVDGFCDSTNGSVYRVRFMPSERGRHLFNLVWKHAGSEIHKAGRFNVTRGSLPGPIRVDPQHPYHFIVSGPNTNWFWNATTTYQLLAWDDLTISNSVHRLAKLGINRIRVALAARTRDGMRWNEPLVKPTRDFPFKSEPWVAARPDDLENPGYDVSRFNLDLFAKADRLLKLARDRGVIVSIIYYVDGRDKGVDPFGKAGMGGPMEMLYYRYVVARLAAFANVMWDVTNEYRLFRDDPWAEQMGSLLKECDPYDHLTSIHGHGDFRFRKSPWADFAMYQSWDDAGGYKYMLKNRREQQALGRPMPQVNEEYGYEDHYPSGWGGAKVWPARGGDNRRRLAWQISMAGCYQTTGERANDGTGAGPDTGGGWINGRGNEHMTMLLGYRHMVEFFTAFPWWELEPREDLAGQDTLVLARPGARYAAYLEAGGCARIQLAPGTYRLRWFNPRTGQWHNLPDVHQTTEALWQSPMLPDAGDWAVLLEKQ